MTMRTAHSSWRSKPRSNRGSNRSWRAASAYVPQKSSAGATLSPRSSTLNPTCVLQVCQRCTWAAMALPHRVSKGAALSSLAIADALLAELA